MLTKDITQTMVTKHPDKVIELVSSGFRLRVTKRGKVLYEISSPVVAGNDKPRTVDAMHLLDDYFIPITQSEQNHDSVTRSIPKQYQDKPALKFGFNLTYRQ